jgi:CDGSH-type Zn-finger protein
MEIESVREISMSPSKLVIKIIPNGPARIESQVAEVILPDGSTVTKEGPFSLCRCGQSGKKPFCDGTHKTCGFAG